MISGVEEKRFIEEDKIALHQQLNRLRILKCKERVLIKEGDYTFVEGAQTEYRYIPEESFNPTPMYVYGNKLSVIIWGNPNYAIIIENKELADAYRKQFNMLWSFAKKVK